MLLAQLLAGDMMDGLRASHVACVVHVRGCNVAAQNQVHRLRPGTQHSAGESVLADCAAVGSWLVMNTSSRGGEQAWCAFWRKT